MITEFAAQLLATAKVRIHCETCGLVFVDVSYNEFLQKHQWDKWDRWYANAGLHWLQNPTHEIVSNLPDSEVLQQTGELKMDWSLSKTWRQENAKSHEELTQIIMKGYEDSRSRDF